MKKLLLILVAILTMVGCRSRKVKVDKKTAVTEVKAEVIEEKKVDNIAKKDSVIQKKTEVKKQDKETNVRVEFDPKKHDSLKYVHVIGNDSVLLDIKGNGIVIFEHKVKEQNIKSEVSTIFGSETLYKIDSAVKKVEEKKTETKIQEKIKAVKEEGFTFGAWFTAGLIAVIIICALWLFYYLGGGLRRKKF